MRTLGQRGAEALLTALRAHDDVREEAEEDTGDEDDDAAGTEKDSSSA